MLDTVHTRDESLQDGLGDVQTHGTTLASAYIPISTIGDAWSSSGITPITLSRVFSVEILIGV